MLVESEMTRTISSFIRTSIRRRRNSLADVVQKKKNILEREREKEMIVK